MTGLSKQLFSGILNFVLNFSSVYLFSNDLLCTPGILLVDRLRQPSVLIGRWGDRAARLLGSTDIPVSKYLNISLSPAESWSGMDCWARHSSHTEARHDNPAPAPGLSFSLPPHGIRSHYTDYTRINRTIETNTGRGDSQDAETQPRDLR